MNAQEAPLEVDGFFFHQSTGLSFTLSPAPSDPSLSSLCSGGACGTHSSHSRMSRRLTVPFKDPADVGGSLAIPMAQSCALSAGRGDSMVPPVGPALSLLERLSPCSGTNHTGFRSLLSSCHRQIKGCKCGMRELGLSGSATSPRGFSLLGNDYFSLLTRVRDITSRDGDLNRVLELHFDYKV